MWVPQIADAGLKYRAIVDALAADIRAGRLVRGERLPPQRAIAEALGVDLTTVTRAFNEARRRGLITAQAGRGTFISDALQPVGQPIDLSMNVPPQPEGIEFQQLIPQELAAMLSMPRGLLNLHYQDSAGSAANRQAAALWLGKRLGPVSAQRVVVTGGAQGALYGLCRALLTSGDVIAAGAFSYPGLKAVASQSGHGLVPLRMDAWGILPEALDQACRNQTIRALYVVPSMDNPATATLPEGRRRELADLARRHDLIVIEDDPYAPLCPGHIPALAELAPERTWHIATLSKCATPALRVAYVAAPDGVGALRLASTLRATLLMAPPLMAALASRWIVSGKLDQITLAIRAENTIRQGIARAVLAGCDMAADPHGHHLWLTLPSGWRGRDFVDLAARAGVSVVSSEAFAIGALPGHAVRLSLGVAPDRSDLEEGLSQLRQLLVNPPLDAKAVI